MKQATGELNLTLVTTSIIGAVLILLAVVIPIIVNGANNTWADNRADTGVNFGRTDVT